jgi:hypothetical protein
MRTGVTPAPKAVAPGRIPRISRLMALAIHFDALIRKGIVRDYSEIARLGGVSKARVSQVMNLLNLAPGIQEEILFLPSVVRREDVTERSLRELRRDILWGSQRKRWASGCLRIDEQRPTP